MTNKKIIAHLNDLVEYLRDSQNGFKESAKLVKDPQLIILFNDLSQQRNQFCLQLSELVLELGGKPEKSGSIMAAAHRVMLNLKSLITDEKSAAIAKEVDRGENLMIEHYQEILDEEMPENVKVILKAQLGKIQKNLSHIQAISNIK